MRHTIDEIRDLAQNTLADMHGYPDLETVHGNCAIIAANDPQLAASIMMTLASWVPLESTAASLRHAEERLIAARSTERLGLVG